MILQMFMQVPPFVGSATTLETIGVWWWMIEVKDITKVERPKCLIIYLDGMDSQDKVSPQIQWDDWPINSHFSYQTPKCM